MARLAGPVWACCPSAFFDPAANALEVFEKTHGRRTVVDVASCGGRNMVSFQFQRDQQVKVRATGKVGTVMSADTDPTTRTPFYRVRFDDGTVAIFPENELWPA